MALSPLIVKIGAEASGLFATIDKAERKLGTLSSKFEEVGSAAVRLSATAAAVGGAIAVMTMRLAENDDQAGKTAQKIGMTVEAYSALAYAAKLSNVSQEQLTGGLKQLSKFMVENKIEGVSVEEQLLRISDEFAAAGNDANKTAVAMKYFGKSGAELIPLLNEGRAGIEGMRKEAERLGLVVTKEAAAAAAEFNDNLTRMQATVGGVARDIGGPLIKALADAAGKFLEARKEGEGFWESMKRGLQEFLTGSDLHKWQKEMADAGETLLRAQNALDRLRHAGGGGLGYVKDLQAAEAAVKAAEENIRRLQAIKPVLAPEPPAKPAAPTGSVTVPDENAAKGAEKKEQEVRDILHKVREEDDKRELEQIALKNAERQKMEEEALRARLALIDYEQAEEIAKGEAILAADEANAARKRQLQQQQLQGTQQFLGNMASLMNTSSRKTFQIGKTFALAEGAVKTALAVVDSYRFGTSIGGPVVGAAMAAAAAAAGINMLNNIRQQSFGGGGGAPTPVGQGASGVAAPAESAPGRSSDGRTAVINITGGEFFSRAQVAELLEKINESLGDGGRIVFAR